MFTNWICMQSIKEHNLKANHNCLIVLIERKRSVCNLSKNTIWKQITTQVALVKICGTLYAIYQRTQSESKSQREVNAIDDLQVCMQSIKEHNLKANHNEVAGIKQKDPSVCNLSKNTIWKQITTSDPKRIDQTHLYAIYQRTQSESKSQHRL